MLLMQPFIFISVIPEGLKAFNYQAHISPVCITAVVLFFIGGNHLHALIKAVYDTNVLVQHFFKKPTHTLPVKGIVIPFLFTVLYVVINYSFKLVFKHVRSPP